jgi:hypothetical protein
MMGHPHPLIVSTCEGQGHTDVPTHQRAQGTAAMIGAFQHWTGPEGIDAIGVIPGEPRTHVEPDSERLDAIHAAMLASADPDDARATLSRAPFEFHNQKVDYVFRTQSIEFPGRAVATLYALDHRSARGGQMWTASDLGRDYGFTDVDGLQPVDPVYGSG